MPAVVTRGEIRGALAGVAGASTSSELADPWSLVDLTDQEDATIKAVQGRLSSGRTPGRGQVFRWPKEAGGFRPMAWIDPYDQVVYRAGVGRLVVPILNGSGPEVKSCRLATRPPRWSLQEYGGLIAERRHEANKLITAHHHLGLVDVQQFFPSVTRTALEQMIGDPLPVNEITFAWLLDWLDDLTLVSGIKGLPTGPDASQVLANAILYDGDALLRCMGVPFLRYVDDVWLFLDDPADFDRVVAAYAQCLTLVGLTLHPDKTRYCNIFEAVDEIQKLTIAYYDEALRDPGPTGRAAGQALFEHALVDPVAYKSELRRALGVLARHRDPAPFEALRADPDLLRLAPTHWVTYLSQMMGDKKARKVVGDDWLVEKCTADADKNTAFANLLYLKVASKIRLSKADGRLILEVATRDGGWYAPVRVWAANAWGKSAAFKPEIAVEQLEEHGDFCTRRAFAMTLASKKDSPKLKTWTRRARLADPELEPTAAWLEAA